MARGSKKAFADQAFKDLTTRSYLLECFSRQIRREIKSISSTKSTTCLRATTANEFQAFRWKILISEPSSKAPTLLSVLQSVTRKRLHKPNTDGVVCMCAAIIAIHQNPTLSLVQKLVTVILFAGHASKQVSIYNTCYVYMCMTVLIEVGLTKLDVS